MKTVLACDRKGNRHVFFAFPPKAQNQQIKAGLLAHLIFAGLLIPMTIGTMA